MHCEDCGEVCIVCEQGPEECDGLCDVCDAAEAVTWDVLGGEGFHLCDQCAEDEDKDELGEDLRQCDGCGRVEDAGTAPDQDAAGRSECCWEVQG